MKIGIIGSFGSARQVVDMASAAEDHGWDGFFTWDGISIGLPDTWDPWSILAAAAVRTSHVTLGAMVFALPRRKPWEVVRQALTVDHLSDGRLVLPVGLGVLDDRAFSGVPGQLIGLRERAELLDDSLAFLDQAWSGETFSFEGTHIRAEDMHLDPRPVSGRIPIWPVGAWPSEKSMGRAARWDGVVPQLRGDRAMDTLSPDDVAAVSAWVTERRARLPAETTATRDAAAKAALSARGPQDDDVPTRPFDVVVQGELPDDPARASAQVRALAQAGATWWIESRWNPTTATPEALMERIRLGPPDH